jgi:predicted AAA+ superfamily ATPase
VEIFSYFPVTGIIGPRQSGKTTLIKMIIRKKPEQMIYLDLESPADMNKLTDPLLFLSEHSDKTVCFDEIQVMPELFSILRPVIDADRRPGRFVILGSASPHLIKDASETLAGRIAYLELSGFSLSEVGKENRDRLWIRGGFPDAYLAPDKNLWYRWVENFVRTYIERDLPMLGLQVPPRVLRKLWSMLAHNHGNIINYSNLARSLDLTSATISRYLYFLEHAFLIRLMQPYHLNIKKRLVKSPKIYLRDTGILHYLLNITDREELEGHPVMGSSWEGFVIEQILQATGNRLEAVFYKSHQGAECDLVLLRSSRPVCAVEIKYSSAPRLTRGNKQAFGDIGAKFNFVITPRSDDYPLDRNTRVCDLWTFLTHYLPEIKEN